MSLRRTFGLAAVVAAVIVCSLSAGNARAASTAPQSSVTTTYKCYNFQFGTGVYVYCGKATSYGFIVKVSNYNLATAKFNLSVSALKYSSTFTVPVNGTVYKKVYTSKHGTWTFTLTDLEQAIYPFVYNLSLTR